MLWDDPLQRDDVKPLRPFEFEAVATSQRLRALLASRSLRSTLTRLVAIPRHAREPSLRVLLSLPPDPTPNQYRPDPTKRFETGLTTREQERQQQQQQQHHSPNYRGRGGNHARGRGGTSRGGGSHSRGGGPRLLESTPEERQEMESFAAEVRKIIQDARDAKGVK